MCIAFPRMQNSRAAHDLLVAQVAGEMPLVQGQELLFGKTRSPVILGSRRPDPQLCASADSVEIFFFVFSIARELKNSVGNLLQ